MLFVTLEIFVWNIDLLDNKLFLLIDIVGFVSKLLYYFVKVFCLMLEEVVEVDLFIYVVDYVNLNYE